MLLMFIYRIISAIVTVTILVPLWITYCIVVFVFTLFNNLVYVNLIDLEVPNDAFQVFGGNKLMLLKFMMAITIAVVEFKQNFKNLKSIKF